MCVFTIDEKLLCLIDRKMTRNTQIRIEMMRKDDLTEGSEEIRSGLFGQSLINRRFRKESEQTLVLIDRDMTEIMSFHQTNSFLDRL